MTRLLPDWLDGYLIYTAESESPDAFHRWVALSTISGALRRRVHFDYGYFLLYPNLYVVLVSPAGRCKKSTAMRIGRSMLAQVPGLNFTTDSISRERMIQDLSQTLVDGHSSMTAFSSEFASLLTTSGLDMMIFLTDIYDCPVEWIHKTKGGGTNKVVGPFLNLQAATTPDWIAREMPLDTVGIGLTARIIFVYQDTPRKRKPFPELSPEQKELEKLLVHDLQQISMIQGEFTLAPDAKEFYEQWYLDKKESTDSNDPRMTGYFERKHVHAIKVAMCLSASVKDDLILTLRDIQAGLEVLTINEDTMAKVFSSVGKNPLTFDIAQIEDVVHSHPKGVSYAGLMNMFKHSVRKEELGEVLEVLCMIGSIHVEMTPDGPVYLPLTRGGSKL